MQALGCRAGSVERVWRSLAEAESTGRKQSRIAVGRIKRLSGRRYPGRRVISAS